MTTLRNYTDCNSVVKETYKKQRMYQCADFVPEYCRRRSIVNLTEARNIMKPKHID